MYFYFFPPFHMIKRCCCVQTEICTWIVSQTHPHDDDNKNICQSFTGKLRVLQIYVIKCLHAVKQHQNYRIQSTRCTLQHISRAIAVDRVEVQLLLQTGYYIHHKNSMNYVHRNELLPF